MRTERGPSVKVSNQAYPRVGVIAGKVVHRGWAG